MATFGDRIKSAWNIFLNPEPYRYDPPEGLSYGRKPDVHRLASGIVTGKQIGRAHV